MNELNIIYYSPTGTSKIIAEKIGEELNLDLNIKYDLSKNRVKDEVKLPKNSLTIFSLPVYAGRLPLNTIKELKKIKGNNSLAVIIVVYGNRDYEDALLELNDIAVENGFKVIGGAAFIGEHSYSTPEKPTAENRPDNFDFEKCKEFSKKINRKLENSEKLNNLVNIPGNYPYKERKNGINSASPKMDEIKCVGCYRCIELCPTNAISFKDKIVTDATLCTWCFACVKGCPTFARVFNEEKIEMFRNWLYTNCSERKEPVMFL